jgi:hypothetical protein
LQRRRGWRRQRRIQPDDPVENTAAHLHIIDDGVRSRRVSWWRSDGVAKKPRRMFDTGPMTAAA